MEPHSPPKPDFQPNTVWCDVCGGRGIVRLPLRIKLKVNSGPDLTVRHREFSCPACAAKMVPRLSPNLLLSGVALCVDLNGQAWWIDCEHRTMIPAYPEKTSSLH
jgi:hypothetical protein